MASGLPGKWLDLQLWSLREAAYLLCGQEPHDEADFKIEMHTGSDVALTYRDLKDATVIGALKFFDVDGTFVRRRVTPADAVAWGRHRAQGRGLGFPEFLGAAAVPVHEATAPAEDVAARQQRRLARFRDLGGDMRRAGSGWQTTGTRGALATLAREEQAAKRPRSDRSDVRRDLIDALEGNRGS